MEIVTSRWMVQADLKEVVAIDRKCFAESWNKEDFLSELRNRMTCGIVAEAGDRILAYAIYNLSKSSILILRIATEPKCQREGFATHLVNTLKQRLSFDQRRMIAAYVPDTNLAMHLFLKSNAFQATHVEPNFYQDLDYYRFEFNIERRAK